MPLTVLIRKIRVQTNVSKLTYNTNYNNYGDCNTYNDYNNYNTQKCDPLSSNDISAELKG